MRMTRKSQCEESGITLDEWWSSVIPHVFEAGDRVATSGPSVPTWVQVNVARDMLVDNIEFHWAAWRGRSTQVWNPFAPRGDPLAFTARTEKTGKSK